MGNEKKEPSTEGPNRARKPASGPLSKELGNDLKMAVARLKTRTEGLTGAELDAEIARFEDQMIEKQLRSPLVRDAARPRLRECSRIN